MGLDLEVYRVNKRGKRRYVAVFSSAGWPVVTYFEKSAGISLNDTEYVVDAARIKDMLDCCKKVLIAYYSRTVDDSCGWISTAENVFPISELSEVNWYDDEYIDNVARIYTEFWNLYAEMSDGETVILDISY